MTQPEPAPSPQPEPAPAPVARPEPAPEAPSAPAAPSDTPIGDSVEQEVIAGPVQFPSLAGDPQAEVAQRQAGDGSGERFLKTFVVSGKIAEDHPMHEANSRRVLEEALQRGLHPKGQVDLVDTRVFEHPERFWRDYTELDYAVDVVPAVIDHEAHTTVTPGAMPDKTAPAAE